MAWREDAHINKLRVGSGSNTTVVTNGVYGVTYTVGADVADTVNVALQLTDAQGNDVAASHAVHWYMSDDADGSSLAATPITTVAIGTDGLLVETISNNAGIAISEADGDIDIDFTKTGADVYYMVCIIPATGALAISGAITFDA